MRHRQHNNRSFLICHRGALGDFILTWPGLRCLRELLSDYHFLGIGHVAYMRLAMTLGLLDSYLNMESANMLEFFSGQALPPEIGSPYGAVLWLSNGQKVGQLLIPAATLPVIVITPFATRGIHVARYYCSNIGNHFPVTTPKNLAEGFSFKRREQKYACIHPGSGSLKKNYAPWLYHKIADELRQAGYPKVGFIVGPVERERGLLEEFAGEWILQPENVERLADVLSEAALYVGNDSGVTHLAAILGTPTIALYKTTDPKIWGALGKDVIHLCASIEESALEQIQAQLKHRRAPRMLIEEGM
jgi:hypothetical protein